MIIFNEPLLLGTEKNYLDQVLKEKYFCGNGRFTKKCEENLCHIFRAKQVFLTSSGSSALSIAAEVLTLEPGDEIILPSFTHVGTASAFALRKAKLVWCDIKPMSRCVDEAVLEKLITPKTKAVITVNYAGMSDNIADIQEICQSHSVILIEDNAHGIGASYQDQPLGSFGDLAITSFHQTKNVHCGEGGALIINSDQFINAAQRIRDRGTNRKEFNEGRIDKWTWWSNGSNYYASEFQAAFLYAQLLELNNVNQHRQELFFRNLDNLKNHLPETALPYVDANCRTNGHGFSILAKSEDHRNQIIDRLHQKAIQTAFHYQPLHKAPYWHGMYKDKMLIATENTADTLLRLPMHYNLGINDVDIVCDELVKSYYQGNYNE